MTILLTPKTFLTTKSGVETNERNTVKCRYNAVQYNMISHTAQQWLKQNIYQNYHSQKTTHSSPSRASYGVSILMIWEENWPHYNGTVYCSEGTFAFWHHVLDDIYLADIKNISFFPIHDDPMTSSSKHYIYVTIESDYYVPSVCYSFDCSLWRPRRKCWSKPRFEPIMKTNRNYLECTALTNQGHFK